MTYFVTTKLFAIEWCDIAIKIGIFFTFFKMMFTEV